MLPIPPSKPRRLETDRTAEPAEVIIDVDHDGQRLDRALSDLFDLSRNRLQQLFQDGLISGGRNEKAKLSTRVRTGDRYLLQFSKTEELDLIPEDIPLDILFEDDYLLVLNKPAGMVVHPAPGHSSGTLVHALIHYIPDLPAINGIHRPGIVHRLDKGTSGSLVVAKEAKAFHALLSMFHDHCIDRQYLAWSRGEPTWKQQRIDQPIGRHPNMRQKMAVNPRGKPASTEVTVERHYPGEFCRLRLRLLTGRTHQIRVHLSHIKLPVLGDPLYARAYRAGKRVPDQIAACINGLDHQALHAEILGFTHPVTNEPLLCRAPLPADLQALSNALDRCNG